MPPITDAYTPETVEQWRAGRVAAPDSAGRLAQPDRAGVAEARATTASAAPPTTTSCLTAGPAHLGTVTLAQDGALQHRAGGGQRRDRSMASRCRRPRWSMTPMPATATPTTVQLRHGELLRDRPRRTQGVAREGHRGAERASISWASTLSRSIRPGASKRPGYRSTRRTNAGDRIGDRHHRQVPGAGQGVFERDGKHLRAAAGDRGAGRRAVFRGVRRPHQRQGNLRRGALPLCRIRRRTARWCSISTRPTTRRARSRRSPPVRWRRRKTGWTCG